MTSSVGRARCHLVKERHDDVVVLQVGKEKVRGMRFEFLERDLARTDGHDRGADVAGAGYIVLRISNNDRSLGPDRMVSYASLCSGVWGHH